MYVSMILCRCANLSMGDHAARRGRYQRTNPPSLQWTSTSANSRASISTSVADVTEPFFSNIFWNGQICQTDIFITQSITILLWKVYINICNSMFESVGSVSNLAAKFPFTPPLLSRLFHCFVTSSASSPPSCSPGADEPEAGCLSSSPAGWVATPKIKSSFVYGRCVCSFPSISSRAFSSFRL